MFLPRPTFKLPKKGDQGQNCSLRAFITRYKICRARKSSRFHFFFPFLHYFLSSSANNWERKPSDDLEATSRDRLRSAWNYWDQPYCSNHFFVKKQLGALKTKRNEASIMSKSFSVRFLSFKVTTRLKAILVSFSNPRRVRSKEVFSKTCTDHTFLCFFTHQIILEFGRGHNNFLQTKKRPRGHSICFFCYASS